MKTLPEIRQQLIAAQKLCKRGVHDVAPVDKKAAGPLIELKRTLTEYLAAHPDDAEALRIMYFVECYLMNYRRGLAHLTRVVELTGERRDKLNLVGLREIVDKFDDLALGSDELISLMAFLDTALRDAPCDHSLRHTKEWLAANVDRKKHAKAISGLRNNGGYCDCEVRCNLTDQ